jgi:3-hydroxyisobutyrate dehydrogenase
MCRATVRCGAVPGALKMKFAVNIFLIASVTGLAEAAQYAEREGLDLQGWADIVNASQMASDISRLKVAKLLRGDFDAQAAIANVHATTRLIVDSAHDDGIPVPLMEASLALYADADARGLSRLDMIAVTRAFGDLDRSTASPRSD